MNRKSVYSVAAIVGLAVAVPAGASLSPEVVRENTFVGPVAVGGLSREDAMYRIRAWWDTERRKPLKLDAAPIKAAPPEMTPAMLGVTIDDVAIADELPMMSGIGKVAGDIDGQEPERTVVAPRFRVIGLPSPNLKKWVAEQSPERSEARVSFSKGAIALKAERAPLSLDFEVVPERVVTALEQGTPVSLPVVEGEKRVPDEDLKRIRQVVSSYSTTFPASNRPRSWNIKLAAAPFDGLVLMPGERISYNEVVGPRTSARGYREAGVYVSGRTDTGIGGGICQVSSTFYNAALLADLKIVFRRNHSLPVPYVPVGRDATVSWGTIDLVIENSMDTPIGISSQYEAGRLTMRILGEKIPGKMVKIESGPRSWRANGTKTVTDRTLKPGQRKVIESGASAQGVTTSRVVYVDGKVVRRESLGRSFYPGSPRIVAVGPAAPASPPIAPPSAVPPPDGMGIGADN